MKCESRIRPMVAAVAIAFIWSLPVFGQSKADSVLLHTADSLRMERKWKPAARIYDELIERNIFVLEALVWSAYCIDPQKEGLEGIMARLGRAMSIEPAYYPALELRSRIYRQNRMYDRAIEDNTVIIDSSTDTTELIWALRERSMNHQDKREFNQAIADASAVLRLDSTNCGAMNTIAHGLFESGNVDSCFVWLEKHTACDTTNPITYELRAYHLQQVERHADALFWFEKAEQHGADLSNGFFNNNRGYSKLMLGDTDGALKDIQRSLKLNPSNSYAYRNLGLVWKAKGEKDKACEAFEEALTRGYTAQFGDDVKKLHKEYCK